jgi:hypothetical protein
MHLDFAGKLMPCLPQKGNEKRAKGHLTHKAQGST